MSSWVSPGQVCLGPLVIAPTLSTHIPTPAPGLRVSEEGSTSLCHQVPLSRKGDSAWVSTLWESGDSLCSSKRHVLGLGGQRVGCEGNKVPGQPSHPLVMNNKHSHQSLSALYHFREKLFSGLKFLC